MSTAVHGFLYVEVSNQGLVAKIKLAKSPPRGAGLGLGMVAVMIQQVFYGIPMYSNVIIPHDSTEHNMFDIVRLFKHVQRMFKGCSEDVQRMFKGFSEDVQRMFKGCSKDVQTRFSASCSYFFIGVRLPILSYFMLLPSSLYSRSRCLDVTISPAT